MGLSGKTPRTARRCAVGCLVWVGCALTLPSARATEPCTDPADSCVESLLDQFTPWLFFEDRGSGGPRREYPVAFTEADDDTVENNKEHLSGGIAYTIYRHAERIDTACAPCWLLEYHYYLPANWQPDVWDGNGYTHEHDWEWIYVFAGWSSRLERYVGYAATLSSHDSDNVDAMRNQHTYLFPLITIDPDREDEFVRGSRRLADWTEDPDVLLARAAVVMTADGNAFVPYEAGMSELQEAGLPARCAVAPSYWQLGQAGTDCRRSTVAENCFGDPSVCSLPFVCSGREECADCSDRHYVPWRRDGMWSADAVPSDFEFPDDPRTSVDPQPGFAWPLEIESTPGGVRVRWEWHAEPPDSFAFTVATDALQWRCRLGAIASRLEAVHQEIVLHSPCLRAPESLGGQLEVWAEWRDGRKTLAANAPLGDGSAALCVRFEPYSNPLNVTRRVRFYLATDASIAIETLDASGRLLDRQWLGRRPAGWQSILWPSSRECLRTLPSGVYWLRVRAGHQSGSCRFCLVR